MSHPQPISSTFTVYMVDAETEKWMFMGKDSLGCCSSSYYDTRAECLEAALEWVVDSVDHLRPKDKRFTPVGYPNQELRLKMKDD